MTAKFHARAAAPRSRTIGAVKLRSLLLASSLLLAATAGCVASSEDVETTEAQLTTVCGQTTVKGIDVYHGDNGGNAIDWNAVKQAGISFAFAKATESTDFTDSMFQANWSGMKAAGIVRGAYHFFHADVDPVAQAQFFLSTVGPLSPGDLLVLDLETTNGQTDSVVEAHAATFLDTVKASSGVTPFLYTSPLFLSSYAQLGAYPLWIAHYGVSCPMVPAPWTTYVFWQSSGGTVGPISGTVDLDSFNGTPAQLEALGGGTSDGGVAGQDGGAGGGTVGAPLPGGAAGAAGGSGGCAVSAPGRDARGGAIAAALLGMVAARRRRRSLGASRRAGS
jgi:lysozyme